MSDIATLLEGGSFFEGPRWHRGRWWVSDFYRERVLTVDPNGDTVDVLRVPGQPSGLGWMPDGSLLVVSRCDRRVLRRWPDGRVSVHADVADLCDGYLNDMVVDRNGRLTQLSENRQLAGLRRPVRPARGRDPHQVGGQLRPAGPDGQLRHPDRGSRAAGRDGDRPRRQDEVRRPPQYGVTLNPDKSALLTLDLDDQVVVLADT